MPELGEDPRFATRMMRVDNYIELRTELEKAAAKKPRAYWTARLEEADVPYAPVNRINEVFEDPHVQAMGTFYTMQHPTEGEIVSVRRPIYVDGDRAVNNRPPPTLGEHNAEVLAPEVLARALRVEHSRNIK